MGQIGGVEKSFYIFYFYFESFAKNLFHPFYLFHTSFLLFFYCFNSICYIFYGTDSGTDPERIWIGYLPP